MSKLLNNQTNSLKLKFIKNSDENHQIGINITVSSNHEVNKDILVDIENKINQLLLTNYQKKDDFDKKQLEMKEKAKNEAKQKKMDEKAMKMMESKQIQDNNPHLQNVLASKPSNHSEKQSLMQKYRK